MTDLWLHFGACFVITYLAFYHFYCVKHAIKLTLAKCYKLDKATVKPLVKTDIVESMSNAIIIGIIAGVSKEVWDIFYSDPQISDLLADFAGVVTAFLLLAATGAAHLVRRYGE